MTAPMTIFMYAASLPRNLITFGDTEYTLTASIPAMIEAAQATQWRDIKTDPPADDVEVLGWWQYLHPGDSCVTCGMDIAYVDRGVVVYGNEWHSRLNGMFTHWQPLPEPPVAENMESAQ